MARATRVLAALGAILAAGRGARADTPTEATRHGPTAIVALGGAAGKPITGAVEVGVSFRRYHVYGMGRVGRSGDYPHGGGSLGADVVWGSRVNGFVGLAVTKLWQLGVDRGPRDTLTGVNVRIGLEAPLAGPVGLRLWSGVGPSRREGFCGNDDDCNATLLFVELGAAVAYHWR